VDTLLIVILLLLLLGGGGGIYWGMGAGWGIACETRTSAADAGSDWVDGLMVVSILVLWTVLVCSTDSMAAV